MTTTLKRKGVPNSDEAAESSKRRFVETEVSSRSGPLEGESGTSTTEETTHPDGTTTTTLPKDPAPTTDARAARFAALRARNQTSRQDNLKETKHEAQRQSIDPTQLTALHRKGDIAQHKLLKAETEERGEDFERKRAWDWTVEESERWDQRMAEKEHNRANVAFQDYSREAGKVYERQVGAMEKDGFEGRRDAYEREKREAIDRAVQSGGLELVETADGDLIAVDRDGSYFSTAETPALTGGAKPDKAAVDRLVADLKKAEDVRLKKRRERGQADDDGPDITFINEKNKMFNMKLARFYNKYTADIRESFERGTAI